MSITSISELWNGVSISNLIFFSFSLIVIFIGLWNLASLFSNLCLFVLMPFAFFFLESEGFAGLKKVSKLSFD